MPSSVRFAEIRRMFERHGWFLARVNGSHHIFQSPTGQTYPIPVHGRMVKYGYYRTVKKLLGEE